MPQVGYFSNAMTFMFVFLKHSNEDIVLLLGLSNMEVIQIIVSCYLFLLDSLNSDKKNALSNNITI